MNRRRFLLAMAPYGVPSTGFVTDVTDADIVAFLTPNRPGGGTGTPTVVGGVTPYDWGTSGSDASHDEYAGIASAFHKFVRTFGQIPAIDAVYFSGRQYEWQDADHIVESSTSSSRVGASVIANRIMFYNVPGGSHAFYRENSQEAELRGHFTSQSTFSLLLDPQQFYEVSALHELTHTFLNAFPHHDDPVRRDFRQRCGWLVGEPTEVASGLVFTPFDAGVSSVIADANATTPLVSPSSRPFRVRRFDTEPSAGFPTGYPSPFLSPGDYSLVEQPASEYMLAYSEDLPECVAAYAYNGELRTALRQRGGDYAPEQEQTVASKRFEFVHTYLTSSFVAAMPTGTMRSVAGVRARRRRSPW
jgi:hypothetical protein